MKYHLEIIISVLTAADEPVEPELEHGGENFNYSYDCLKDLDPDAANRIHPNNNRKVRLLVDFYFVCFRHTTYLVE